MGHFYDKTGEPVFEVPKADGNGMRPTTIIDCVRLKLYPSITTVNKIIAQPGLMRWIENSFIESCFRHLASFGERLEWYTKRIRSIQKDQAMIAPKWGNNIHEYLDAMGKHNELPEDIEYLPAVQSVKEWYSTNDIEIVSTEHRLIPLVAGIAGTADVVAKYKDTDRYLFIDYKSTITLTKSGRRKKLRPYDTYVMQLAKYAEGIGLEMGIHDKEHWIIYISRDEPGYILPYQIDNETAARGLAMFNAAYTLWKLLNGYDPADV